MKLAQTFGRNVRLIRQGKGLTIETLADEVCLSYSYVGELERGKRNPSLRVIGRFAEVLGVSPAELLI
ncbi:MAG: helix-turn-helix domain-containing protein [Alphaproteobacteria bacterium]|jgi:transcriptional regulator with XRE-family HTH domain|uniref:Helix-turn-helix transcriptional regulator n=1 Tax=Brevundimonas aurifodinae TaxID=1508312 RepID=A0ABV1NK96_9CAUL|nr:helix-turn-helix domain-containing protein [Alphaproteobacteria bacterium]MBU2040846.1 helix-turn-helix domain-containing protein [Alphaproteobacteria bacterium]MBU2127312.1 helix-turn-helix domain-containing protein [Alphaproteobacteria bacterium]MBU2207730.1 helix-turn-helix domain-containing protein [Alphaproteobacteria bacterium]MBU2291070.1 helix-turn-helix domain-containing protein [Alphaproteobacteria bacterium]